MINKKIMKKFILTILIVLACFLSNLSQLPYFISKGTTQILSVPIWILLFLTLIVTNRFKISKALINILVLMVLFIMILIILYIISSKDYFSSSLFYSTLISVFILIIGSLISPIFNKDIFRYIVISYVLSSLVVSLVVFVKYFGIGFSLDTRIYAYSSKNSLSQIILTSVIILFCYFKPRNRWEKVNKIIIIIFDIFMLFILRSRASILGFTIVSLIIAFDKRTNIRYRRIVIIANILLLILLSISDEFKDLLLNKIIFAGRDFNDLDNLSSGRISILRDFPVLIRGNWLTGIGPLYFESFPLSAILQFGIFAGGILIYLSILPLLTSAKRRNNELRSLLYYISIAYFVNSLFEGLAPFGPGIKCYFLWLLFGILNSLKE